MNTEYDLFLIDAQNDFCDLKGALRVENADQDMYRLSEFMKKINFGMIMATLDTHHAYSIFHPSFWIDKDTKHPAPFTLITKEDVDSGKWMATFPQAQTLAQAYVTKLAEGNRFSLVIWPEHCLQGTWGSNLFPVIGDALSEWERKNQNSIVYVTKGLNPYTEFYSAFRAEIPLKDVDNTNFNAFLYEQIKSSPGKILIAGEASNFCVMHTIKDLVNYDAIKGDGSITEKLIYLSDCCSPVTGFEDKQKEFISFLNDRKIQITTSVDFKPE